MSTSSRYSLFNLNFSNSEYENLQTFVACFFVCKWVNCIGHLYDLPPFLFYKVTNRNNFFDFLVASMGTIAFSKQGLLLKEGICSATKKEGKKKMAPAKRGLHFREGFSLL